MISPSLLLVIRGGWLREPHLIKVLLKRLFGVSSRSCVPTTINDDPKVRIGINNNTEANFLILTSYTPNSGRESQTKGPLWSLALSDSHHVFLGSNLLRLVFADYLIRELKNRPLMIRIRIFSWSSHFRLNSDIFHEIPICFSYPGMC